MRDPLFTYLRSRPGSPFGELAESALVREEELKAQREAGSAHELMARAPQLEAAAGQLRLKLSGYDARANVRLEVARYIEQTVLPELHRRALSLPVPIVTKAESEPAEELGEPPARRKRRAPLDVLPLLPNKLRVARREFWCQMNVEDAQGTRIIWDEKAGEPLLCPDDAREEAMRLQRRLEEELEELARQGLRVYYGVLTIENAPPGHLAGRVEKLWRKFKRALKARENPRRALRAPRLHVHATRTCTKKSWRHSLSCRRAPPMLRPPVRVCTRRVVRQRRIPNKQLKPLFPTVGAIATLEAPLSASRTWHPHLNVILVTRGMFDYSAWWKHWGCVSDWRHLKPGNVAGAFRELIKYAVRAVPEKSAAKAAHGESTCNTSLKSSFSSVDSPSDMPSAKKARTSSSGTTALPSAARSSAAAKGSARSSTHAPGPAMIEWTGSEWLEWWQAMKGRRRTRTYGELYGLNVEPEERSGRWVTIGKGHYTRTGYQVRIELLECIPGDKSILNVRTRYERWLQGMTHPPDFYRELAELSESARQLLAFSTMQA